MKRFAVYSDAKSADQAAALFAATGDRLPVLLLDATNANSYPGAGRSWMNVVGMDGEAQHVALADGGHAARDNAATPFPGLELVSRGAKATADAHGNLGAPSVVVQDVPGADWLKDRWQAASDMGGTAIPGEHWIALRLRGLSTVLRARLDWEAAYCDDYAIQVSEGNVLTDSPGSWQTLWEGGGGGGGGGNSASLKRRTSRKSGVSPGAASEPLHVVHDVDLRGVQGAGQRPSTARWVRILMRKPAHGWGVSLWQLSLWGQCSDAANICDTEVRGADDGGGAAAEDRSWRSAAWLTGKKYCDDYNSAAFKAAATLVQQRHFAQPTLAHRHGNAHPRAHVFLPVPGGRGAL